ncbi:ABC transporter permease, partial [bacterium]|nr:ABC transporter permease [bacterium]
MAENLSISESSIKGVLNSILQYVALPVIGILAFLLVWSLAANSIDTSLGKFPGPSAVAEQFQTLSQEHSAERAKEQAFYERQEKRNAERVAKDPNYKPKVRAYTGKAPVLDHICTSLQTVMSGFILAVLFAIPLGIRIGLSQNLITALNHVIQRFKMGSTMA